ncbi:NAD(P)/FAD-dependent oxidoreductase [Gorillibacterium sp. sgz5001074]|uniref:NAD(P)/FAD-dependent oxidoreductase n=1 Tax=Gorillibacterium sp. sgz5001074 TaxID=3446695 RepID=UPI003F664507
MNKNQETVLIVGGGYAGIHLADALNQAVEKRACPSRIVLIDAEGRHFRKVRLVQSPVRSQELAVPLASYGWKHVELLQARLEAVRPTERSITCTLPDGTEQTLAYDRLVLALGSVPKEAAPGLGGHTLQEAAAIRTRLEQLELQARSAQAEEADKLLQAVVVGGGISGIETAAELAARLGRVRAALGLAGTGSCCVHLIHAGSRLLPEAPARISHRLTRKLRRLGVETVLGSRAERYADGALQLADGQRMPAPVCVWTLGVEPAPLLARLGLPLHRDGRLLTDPWYRVEGYDTIYAIGDNARITDPSTGTADGMTCKEAAPQAKRLAAVLQAQAAGAAPGTAGGPAPHAGMAPAFCIGLGEGEGFVWMRKWGLDLVLTGSLGWRVREWTWNIASLLK